MLRLKSSCLTDPFTLLVKAWNGLDGPRWFPYPELQNRSWCKARTHLLQIYGLQKCCVSIATVAGASKTTWSPFFVVPFWPQSWTIATWFYTSTSNPQMFDLWLAVSAKHGGNRFPSYQQIINLGFRKQSITWLVTFGHIHVAVGYCCLSSLFHT